MALAVVAALAVRVVVLLVVRHEVVEREPVVRRHEVDRRERAAAVGLVEVAAAGQPGGELAQRAGLAAPEVADGVAVLAVPLRPQRREVADLVATGPDVPRLGDQLGLADHGVLLDQVEEHRQPVDVVELAGQGRREVEPESVDVHLGDPVPQRVHDQLQRVRVAHVQRVARAGVVHVVARVVVDQPVVRGVVDPAHRQRGAHVVALGRVVVDHVEDHLDARVVQVADHRLELLHLAARPAVRLGVGVVRGEERDGVVAPVVGEALLLQVVVGDELVHGHELDGRDPQPLEVVDHQRVRETGVGAAQRLGDVGVRDREALDVRLVDHRLVVGDARVAVAAPVEERVDDHRLGHERRGVLLVALVGRAERVAEHRLVPLHRAVEGLGVGVDQQLVRVAALPLGGVVRAVDPVAVALARLDGGQVAVPDEAVDLAQRDAGLGRPRGGVAVGEQAQLHALGDLGEDREVRPGAVVARAQGVRTAWPRPHGVLALRHWPARRRR